MRGGKATYRIRAVIILARLAGLNGINLDLLDSSSKV